MMSFSINFMKKIRIPFWENTNQRIGTNFFSQVPKSERSSETKEWYIILRWKYPMELVLICNFRSWGDAKFRRSGPRELIQSCNYLMHLKLWKTVRRWDLLHQKLYQNRFFPISRTAFQIWYIPFCVIRAHTQ